MTAPDANQIQQGANLTTDLEPEREETLRAVANAIVSEKNPANFEHGSMVPPTSDQIIVRDAIADIPLHAEEAIARLVLKAITVHLKQVLTFCRPLWSR